MQHQNRKLIVATLAFVAIVNLTACAGEPTSLDEGSAKRARSSTAALGTGATPGSVATLNPDDEDARIDREELIGYAGSFLDRNTGEIVVRVRGEIPAPGVMEQFAARHANRFSGHRARWETADYGFSELKGYFDLLARDVKAFNGTFLDVDEVANRVRVGIHAASDIATLNAVLASRGIPRAAIVTEIAPYLTDNAEPADADATGTGPGDGLQGYNRPLVGGLQTEYLDSNSGHMGLCTIGAVGTDFGSVLGFVTAGHCSTITGGAPDSTLFYQGYFNGVTSPVARKAIDPAFNPFMSGCSAGYSCRQSDAQFAEFDAFGPSYSQGYIAQPVSMDDPDTTQAKWIANPAGIKITSMRAIPLAWIASNTTVFKVGRTTGLTTGTVGNTCVSVFLSNGHEFLCQVRVNGIYPTVLVAWHGDSGASVFSGSESSAMWEGILSTVPVSPSSNYYYFSPSFNVIYELSATNHGLNLVAP